MTAQAAPGGAGSAGAAGPAGRAKAGLRALEVLDRLTATGTAPSDDDLAVLRGWAGWGPMAPAFSSRRSGAWKQIGERLEWLLPPDQRAEAQQATQAIAGRPFPPDRGPGRCP